MLQCPVARVRDDCIMQTSKIPTYERMWNFMERHEEDVFVNSTKDGLDKVLNDNYAFLLESTMNEYVTQRNCQLMQVGGLLDAKGYGIATPRGTSRTDTVRHRTHANTDIHTWAIKAVVKIKLIE